MMQSIYTATRRPRNMGGVIIALLLACVACKRFTEVPLPGTETFAPDIFESDLTATSAVVGIYGEMIGNTNSGFASGSTRSVTYLSSLSADELENFSRLPLLHQFSVNDISPSNQANQLGLWTEAYRYIYAANGVLEGLKASSKVSYDVKTHLEGEALFIRAFCYFYLVNLYGDVPLALTTDHKRNNSLGRSPREAVYHQITEDLEAAVAMLGENYITIERIRPNKWAAQAMLARVCLFTGNWLAAEQKAITVIETGTYSLDSLSGVFGKNSKEAIWQLRPNTPGLNTWEGRYFSLTGVPQATEGNSTTLSDGLLSEFEAGDNRRLHWVGSLDASGVLYYYPAKYKISVGNGNLEYSVVLRLAEQYLIRAEARARQGKLVAGLEDLNVIRLRAGLPPAHASSKNELLEAILAERRKELFTEWGHRWLDLKRAKKASTALAPIKGQGWGPLDTLYPIPLTELTINPNLSQNQGY